MAGILPLLFGMAMFAGMLYPANATSMSKICPPELQVKGFALNRLANNLGATIGPAIGGVLALRDLPAALLGRRPDLARRGGSVRAAVAGVAEERERDKLGGIERDRRHGAERRIKVRAGRDSASRVWRSVGAGSRIWLGSRRQWRAEQGSDVGKGTRPRTARALRKPRSAPASRSPWRDRPFLPMHAHLLCLERRIHPGPDDIPALHAQRLRPGREPDRAALRRQHRPDRRSGDDPDGEDPQVPARPG